MTHRSPNSSSPTAITTPEQHFAKRMATYAIAGFLFYVSGVAVYTGIDYRRMVQAETEQLDQRLAVGAQAVYNILGAEFFERARQPDAISAAEDWDNIRQLSEFNDTADLAFIYSAILIDGEIYLTSSSATAAELADQVEVRYFDHYDTASPSLHEVFRDPATKYVNYTDEWGNFRAVFVPYQLTDNTTVVLAAEVDLHELTALRWRLIQKSAWEAVIFLGLVLPLFVAIVNTQHHANAALRRQNNTDALTGLDNRSGFLETFAQAVNVATRDQENLGLLFLDLDGFKEVNDGFGHLTGDRILVAVARLLQSKLSPQEQLFRVGGDEFCILVQGDRDRCEDLTSKIIYGFKQSIGVSGYEFFITCSVGISLFPQQGQTIHELLKQADLAMYAAKARGLNQFNFYTESMSGEAKHHVILRQQLETALAQQEFFFAYQPQVHSLTGQIIGVEALLRWRRGQYGLVPPGEFIPYAETTGLIDDIFEQILGSALANAARWNRETSQPFKVSLNYSCQQLFRAGFDDTLIAKLAEHQCDPHWIELEITERSIMRRSDDLLKILQRLRDRGITISVDDFGTGYSSLSYLKDLPVDKIKVDKSFVDGLPHDQGSVALTRAIVELSVGLGLSVVAEGVEQPEQVDFLTQMGCAHVQGYVFYRPLPAAEITNLIEAGQGRCR